VSIDEIETNERSAIKGSLVALGVLMLIVIGGLALTIYVARLLWGLSTQ
ncbi:MAG: hypothetical protein H7Z74_00335, partial [Anaerolineae bacterium]|nr:hypothetical protein [Gemmatimonadaceae bacterium]